MKIAPHHGKSRFGLDLGTSLLANANGSDIEALVSSVLQPLVQEGHLQSLTIASNALTFHNANTLLQWAGRQNREHGADVHIVATEVLRCHSRKPGLLSGGYPYAVPHRMASNTIDVPAEDAAASALLASKSAEVQARMQSVAVAASDFQMALDRCIHTEKIFLNKVRKTAFFTSRFDPIKSHMMYGILWAVFTKFYCTNFYIFLLSTQLASAQTSGVPATDVCLAHVLTNTYAQFQYPEEWLYVHTHQVQGFVFFNFLL